LRVFLISTGSVLTKEASAAQPSKPFAPRKSLARRSAPVPDGRAVAAPAALEGSASGQASSLAIREERARRLGHHPASFGLEPPDRRVRRKLSVSYKDEVATATRSSISLVLEQLQQGAGSRELTGALTYLFGSSTSHLVIAVVPADSGQTTHGTTDIRVGKLEQIDPPLIQEQIMRNPWRFFFDPHLTVQVTLYVPADQTLRETAVTLLHELELHAVPAIRLLRTIDGILAAQPNVEKIVNAVLAFMMKPDEHRDLERLVGLIQGAAQLRNQLRSTPFAAWGQRVLKGVCTDAIEQLAASALRSGADEEALGQLKYLGELAKSLEAGAKPPAPLPEGASTSSPTTTTTGRRSPTDLPSVPKIAEIIRKLVVQRMPWQQILFEMTHRFGVPKEMTIDLYHNAVVPWLAQKLPQEANQETRLRLLLDHGVPQSIAVDVILGKKMKRSGLNLPELDYARTRPPAERRAVFLNGRRFELDPDEIANDGDCFFNAVIALGAHGGRSLTELRQLARDNGGRMGIQNQGAWAHDQDIEALARGLGRRFFVVRLDLDYTIVQHSTRGTTGDPLPIAHIFGGHFTPLRRKAL
jgi:hypothetical protein